MMGEYTAIPFHLLTAFDSTQPPPLKTRQSNKHHHNESQATNVRVHAIE